VFDDVQGLAIGDPVAPPDPEFIAEETTTTAAEEETSTTEALEPVPLSGMVFLDIDDDGAVDLEAEGSRPDTGAQRITVNVESAGETIEVRSSGIRKMSDATAERIARGEMVTPDEYYFRTHIRLTTSAPRLARLNDVLAVSTGARERDVVHIHVHEVL